MEILGATSMTLPAAVLGCIQGQIGAFINKWLDYKYQSQLADNAAQQQARMVKNKRFQFTRRLLALMIFGYICIGCFVMPFYGIPIYVAYSENNGFFKTILVGASTVHWVAFHGFVLTPTHTYLAALFGTLYSGGRRV